MWKNCIFQNRGVVITQTEIMKAMAEEYCADKEKFQHKYEYWEHKIYACLDVNNDSYISFDEYIVIFRAFGIEDKDLVRRVFDLYREDGHDLIPCDVIVKAWVDFKCSDDPNNPNKMLKVFEDTH